MKSIAHQDFLFIDNNFSVNENIFYARATKNIFFYDQLITSIYFMLWVPPDYKNSYAELHRALMNLSWIDEEYILLRHHIVPTIDPHDLVQYLDILTHAVIDNQSDKKFGVVFDLECYDEIQEIKTKYLLDTVKRFNISGRVEYISPHYQKFIHNMNLSG